MIKAVIFDIDGVLLDSAEANTELFRKIFLAHGHKPLSLRQYMRVNHLTMKQLFTRFATGASAEQVEIMWRYAQKIPRSFELYRIPEGANDAVRSLHKKYTLALVSNRTKRGVENYLAFSKTRKYWNARISSEDITHPKPHPESLLLAAKRLKVKPSECIYIGDTKSDLLAATAAGMKAILYTSKKIPGATFCTSSFRKISALIEKL